MSRTVLITGVAAGIGRATAKTFVDAGWKVIGIDKNDMNSIPAEIDFLKGDVSDPEDVEKLLGRASDIVNNLDALVNNAAIQICKPFTALETNEWDKIMSNNLRSIYLTIKGAYQMLSKQGGAIVNISSVHALATSNNISAYAASKGAVVSLTRALALDFAKDNIRVNAVLPGAVDTEMLRLGLNRDSANKDNDNKKLLALASVTPLKRLGKPEEIAQSILFMADNDRSSFITGQALAVDGGALSRLSTE